MITIKRGGEANYTTYNILYQDPFGLRGKGEEVEQSWLKIY